MQIQLQIQIQIQGTARASTRARGGECGRGVVSEGGKGSTRAAPLTGGVRHETPDDVGGRQPRRKLHELVFLYGFAVG